MKSWEAEFLDFAKSMWFENCVERSDWQNDPLDFDAYVDLNREWLKNQHVEHKLNNMRSNAEWT